MGEYFSEPKSSERRVKAELDFSIYSTKADLKIVTVADTSEFAKKIDLASLKFEGDNLGIDKLQKVSTCLNSLESKVDKLDVDKLVSAPVDLSKISYVVN